MRNVGRGALLSTLNSTSTNCQHPLWLHGHAATTDPVSCCSSVRLRLGGGIGWFAPNDCQAVECVDCKPAACPTPTRHCRGASAVPQGMIQQYPPYRHGRIQLLELLNKASTARHRDEGAASNAALSSTHASLPAQCAVQLCKAMLRCWPFYDLAQRRQSPLTSVHMAVIPPSTHPTQQQHSRQPSMQELTVWRWTHQSLRTCSWWRCMTGTFERCWGGKMSRWGRMPTNTQHLHATQMGCCLHTATTAVHRRSLNHPQGKHRGLSAEGRGTQGHDW